MKKRVIINMLAVSMILTMAGCGNEAVSDVSSDSQVISVEAESDSAEVQESTEENADSSEALQESTEESTESSTVEVESSEGEQEMEITEESQEIVESTDPYEMPVSAILMQKGVLYGQIKEISYDSKTTGSTRKANIILPANYSEEKEYPVLYLLHGIGGDHNEWKGGNPDRVVANAAAAGGTREMIVVIPNVRARANDGANPGDIYSMDHYLAFDNFINDLRDDLMPFIEENYSVATGKENTAIAGLSMGGRESLYIGFSMPETFGYIGAFTPAPGILPYTNFGVTEGGLFTEESFTLPEGSDNYVMIVAGEQDTVVAGWPKSYHETLEKNGVEHVYYETKGGHDFTVWRNALYNFVKNIFPQE